MEEQVLTLILHDGNPSGIIECEIDEWFGICYKIPQKKLKEAQALNYINNTGIYILLGDDENTADKVAYIGETESIYSRLKNHNKNFWNECIVFMSENNSLNKAHIKYIEHELYELGIQANRFIVNNDNTPITDTKFNRNTKDLFEDLDDTTDTVGTDKSTGGNALGVTLGVGAAIGAATVGAKVYKEHKENSDLDLNPDRPSNENKFWTDEDANVIHSEKEEFEIEDKNNNINEEVGDTLIEESSIPTAYQATSNNIKEEEKIDTNVDTWSMPSDNVNLFEE